jgi:hypothetical protein
MEVTPTRKLRHWELDRYWLHIAGCPILARFFALGWDSANATARDFQSRGG